MHRRPGARRGLAALLATALLAACGEARPPRVPSGLGQGPAMAARVEVSSDIAALVPDDAAVLLHAPSMEQAFRKARDLVGQFDPDLAQQLGLAELLTKMPGGAHVDASAPLALAMRFPEGGEPALLVCLPMRNVEAGAAAIEADGMPVTVHGRYVAVPLGTPGPPAPRGENPLLRDLPAGDLVLRCDVGVLLRRFGRELDELTARVGDGLAGGVGRASGPGARWAVALTWLGGLRDLLERAERLDVVLGAEGGRLALSAELRWRPGAVPDLGLQADPALAALAGALPPAGAVQAVFRVEADTAARWSGFAGSASLAGVPDARREALARALQAVLGLRSEGAGPQFALAGDVRPDGLRLVSIARCADPEAVRARYLDTLLGEGGHAARSEVGLRFEDLGATTIAGREVFHVRMHLDGESWRPEGGEVLPPGTIEASRRLLDALSSADGVDLHLAATATHLVQVVGPADALGTVLQALAAPGAPTPAMARGLERTGGAPGFLLTIDLNLLMPALRGALGGPAGARARDGGTAPAAMLLCHGRADAEALTVGCEVDVVALARLVRDTAPR
jgi:hypothetical protein